TQYSPSGDFVDMGTDDSAGTRKMMETFMGFLKNNNKYCRISRVPEFNIKNSAD
ncbi:1960_t:CDS:1, partial [Dentiscutata heterogama]